MSSWDEIKEKWSRAQQMGYQAIRAAMDVGDELTQKKIETPKGEFVQRVAQINIKRRSAYNLMRLALHRDLIEENKPDSMRGALALLPKVPRKTSQKQMDKEAKEIKMLEAHSSAKVKQQAEMLAKKKIKLELERLQNDAHDAIVTELKAVKAQLQKERDKVFAAQQEADALKLKYQDLINKKFNGVDINKNIKTIKQAIHPDKPETSKRLQNLAMRAIKNIEHLLVG